MLEYNPMFPVFFIMSFRTIGESSLLYYHILTKQILLDNLN